MLTDSVKRMAEIVLRDFFVFHDSFENMVETVGGVRTLDGCGKIEHFSRLRTGTQNVIK